MLKTKMYIFKSLINFCSKMVFFPFLCLFTFQVLADEEVINSSVFVLMDYSSTYYKDYRHQLIKDNFRKLTSVLGSQRAGPKPTTTIQVFPIDELSQSGKKLCEFRLLKKRRITFRQRDRCGLVPNRQCSADRQRFDIYMNTVCNKSLFVKRAANKTDISGALSLISQLSKFRKDEEKFLFIFSDMVEDRSTNIEVSKIDLKDFKIMVVCHSEPLEDALAQNKKLWCVDSESEWASKLKSYGAKKVIYTIETAEWNGKLARDFFND